MKPYTLCTQSSHKYTAGFSIKHLALIFVLLLAVASNNLTTLAAAPATQTSSEAKASARADGTKKKTRPSKLPSLLPVTALLVWIPDIITPSTIIIRKRVLLTF